MKFFLLMGICFLSFYHSEWLIAANKEMIVFFFEQLLPGMFFLMVLIRMYLDWHQPHKRQEAVFQKCFGLNSEAFSLTVMALLLGFPGGAILIDEAYQKGWISQLASKRLISCVSCASVSFMLMSVSTLFHSISFALRLYVIQLTSVFLLLIGTRKNSVVMQKESEQPSFFVSLSQSIRFTLHTMSLILAYLLIIASIRTLLTLYLPAFTLFFSFTLEFSSGLYRLSQSYFSSPIQLFLASALLSFGGFSVHLQILGSTQATQLSYMQYWGMRMIHIFISVLLTILMLVLFPF